MIKLGLQLEILSLILVGASFPNTEIVSLDSIISLPENGRL